MIDGVPAAAPDNAPRPRLAPWLVAVAAVCSASALVFGGAWYGLPVLAPVWVLEHSPWADPAVRSALGRGYMLRSDAMLVLGQWTEFGPGRWEQLVPFLDAKDHRTLLVAVGALAHSHAEKPFSIDSKVLHLLDDPDPDMRCYAAMALVGAESLPALKAHLDDPDENAAEAIRASVARLSQAFIPTHR